MNDKQQLAAMGEHMAEQAGQEQPLCMAKRIEELEAQVLVMNNLVDRMVTMMVMAGYEAESESFNPAKAWMFEAKEALSGNLPIQVTPEGWQLVPVEPAFAMLAADGCKEHHEGQECTFHKNRRRIWAAMLAAAPKPEAK